ncbi:hypothetical protein BR93DRAFT_596808 [Coniochaeta sp. PMI_546]|nr:hypothetical protein BR93DRAFT_596808 [Coniochaeta sp. PMI_546]
MLGSRRHRPPPKQQPLTAATAHPNAAMAAAAVFKSREQQTPSLSAAAAAAALRARPMTPTNVGEVQTKRTMRRNASVSSFGSAPDAQNRPGLHRRGSSASMTERTFRSPSPGARRPGSSASDNIPTQSREPAPPVPALPKNVDRMGNGQHRKTQSLQISSPPLRLASETLGKPGAGSWFGAAQVGDLSSVRTSDAAMASPPLSPPPIITNPGDDERPDSRNSSINFSYPSRVRVGSPPVSPTTARGYESSQLSRPQDQAAKRASSGSSSLRTRPASTGAVQSMVYDPNSRRMVPREPPSYDDLQGPSGRSLSVRKKKKQPAKTGTHLAQATMGRTKVAPAAAAYENAQPPQAVPVTSRSARQDEPEHEPRQVLTTSYHVVDDEADDVTDHEPTIADAPAKTKQPTETGRVPFATHAAHNLVDPKPQEAPQRPQHGADEEPAVKALISAPRSEATKTEQQRQQEPVSPTNAYAPGTDGSEEFTWVGEGVRRQPSTVKEEPEPEDEEPQSHGGSIVAGATDAAPARQRVYQSSSQQPQPSVAVAQPESHSTPARQSATNGAARPSQTSPASEPKPVAMQARKTSNIQRERSLSSSPARTARFGTVQDSLTVKHCPPPRSVSPRKSALKNSASPDRRASIDDNVSEASTSFSQREDPAITRKKSVRVSFDDSNTVVVGESPGPEIGDSPILASPQNSVRRPWYSGVGRSKKPEIASLDDDEIMKPRPVLPSFGSVRDKKPRDNVAGHEERALVRPVIDPATSPSIPASPSSLPAIPHVSDELRTDTSLNAMTTGSDSIGSPEAESDRRAKVAANTSRFREPLPPVVTSIEGSGYVSDTSSSEDDQSQVIQAENSSSKEEHGSTTNAQTAAKRQDATVASLLSSRPNTVLDAPAPSSEASFVDAEAVAEDKTKAAERIIPTIAVSMPTPPATKILAKVYFDVPGGFPDDDSEPPTPDAEESSKHASTNQVHSSTTTARQVTFEPVSQSQDGIQTPHTPATVMATLAPVVDEDDDESSIYSDAPDHFTDTDNEGFLSLDAVVESSITSRAKNRENELNLSKSAPEAPGLESAPSAVSAPPHLGTELSTATTAVDTTQQGEPAPLDWDKAKAYWRSLTADKRAQLEREALSDAGVDADVEEDPEVSQKPKKKKSIERRNSERKALAVHMAQQTIAAQQQKQADEERYRAAERTYMIKPGTKVGEDIHIQRGAEEKPKLAPKNAETAPKLRTSMRTNGSAPKPSQQPEQPRQHALGGKTLRPTSVGQAPATTKTMRAPQRVSSPPVAAVAARNSFNPPPPIRRRGSDSSESSFRRSSRPDSGGFGFRKTLRQQSPAQSDRVSRPSGRFSLRSMSPPSPSSRTAPSGGMGMGMRHSLRGSVKETKGSGGGLHFGGFGKGPAKSPAKSKAGSSRFSDSSDDDAGPRNFRSRFDESSDEDDIRSPPLAPLSIPKTMRSGRQGTETVDWGKGNRRYQPPDEVSPPLPEEQEESDLEDNLRHDEEKEMVSPLPKRQNSRSGRGDLVSSSPAAAPLEKPKASRRGSFMSVLRRRKNKTGGIARPEVMDSAARRDTKLERSADELKEIRRSGDLDRESEEAVVGSSRPRSPRLQKRTNSMPLDAAVGGGSWPLGSPGGELGPPPPTNGVGKGLQRPSTSGNLGTRTMSGLGRPTFGQRRTASSNLMGVGVGEGSVVGTVGGERKKKKFGALRKMFGLDD